MIERNGTEAVIYLNDERKNDLTIESARDGSGRKD